MPAEVLSTRQLSRALLARQGLLERSDAPVADMVERLAGMQAQVPSNPYVALWSRLRDFQPEELSDLLAGREAVRAGTMRNTIHLVTARDCLAFQPVTMAVLASTFQSNFAKLLDGAGIEEVTAAGAELLAEQPRTRAELSALLAPRWPGTDPGVLGYVVTHHAPLVHVPPRGLWRQSGQTRFALTEDWLGAPLDPGPSAEAMVLRYLAAFGPASVADVRTWSRLTGLREVVERLRPQLRTFRDERGRELFDVPDGALPDPATPAPPRFLPEYDNVLLSHDDRSRVMDGPFPLQRGTWIGTLLVDGFMRATWRIEAGDRAVLTVEGFAARRGDPAGTRDEIVAEGTGLLELVAPEASERRVELRPPR